MFQKIGEQLAKGFQSHAENQEKREKRENIVAKNTQQNLRLARSGLELKPSLSKVDQALVKLSNMPVIGSAMKFMRVSKSTETIDGVEMIKQKSGKNYDQLLQAEAIRLRNKNSHLDSDVIDERYIQQKAREYVDQLPQSKTSQEAIKLQEGVKAFTEQERTFRDSEIEKINKSLESKLETIQKNPYPSVELQTTDMNNAKLKAQKAIDQVTQQFQSEVIKFDKKQAKISVDALENNNPREQQIATKTQEIGALTQSIQKLELQITAYNELQQKIKELTQLQVEAEKYTKTLNGLIDTANKLPDDTSTDLMITFAKGMNIPNPENIASKGALVDLLRKELSGNESEILSVVDNLTSLNTKLDKIQINELNSDLKTDTGTKNTLEKEIKDLTLPKSTPNTPTAQQVK